ncbi:MAG: hypothetical protein ABH879_03090 [archaeon]
MQIPCIKCKGDNPRANCGRDFCPIVAKSDAMYKVSENVSENFSGSSPAPFVGRHRYPRISVGILSPPERTDDAWRYDAPGHWAEKDYAIPELVRLRSSLVNSRFRSVVTDAVKHEKLLGISQEIGMASRPVDVEIQLDRKPSFKVNLDPYIAPLGPNAQLKKAEITSNPKISQKVDKVVSDKDLKARDAVEYLYAKSFDENFLAKLLSVGTIGVKLQRRLVPTRWSIPAVDDMIGNKLAGEIKDYSQAGCLAFFGGYLGNYFLVMCFPEVYSYELFETYMPKSSWNVGEKMDYTTDFEPYAGRKTYAENCGGGFYACRIAVLEKLKEMKRQASVLVVRVITGEYAVPLGVWVVREAARKALQKKPIEFGSKELMMRYAAVLARKKFGFDADEMLKKSVMLREMKSQMKLGDFHKI